MQLLKTNLESTVKSTRSGHVVPLWLPRTKRGDEESGREAETTSENALAVSRAQDERSLMHEKGNPRAREIGAEIRLRYNDTSRRAIW